MVKTIQFDVDDLACALEVAKVLEEGAWNMRHDHPGTANMLDGVIRQIRLQAGE